MSFDYDDYTNSGDYVSWNNPGDRIRVTYTSLEKTERGGTMKVFTLDVKPGVAESLIQPAVANTTEPF